MGTRTAPRQKRTRTRRQRVLLVLMAMLMVVLADVVGTALLQAVGLYRPGATAERAFRRSDPIYHHGLQPSRSIEDGGRWGRTVYAIHTNSLGFKDASPRDVSLQAQGRRMLLIGDSFTEGVGVAYEHTFAGLLAAHYADASRAEPIEVLNAGCVSYSPVIYRRRVESLLEAGLEFQHLVVCVDLSDIVDEVKSYRLDEHGHVVDRVERLSERLKHFVAEHTMLLAWVRHLLHEIRESTKDGDRHVVGHEKSSWTRDPKLWERYGKPGLESASLHLDALWKLLQSRGIRMTLVVYPWPDQILNGERDCAQVTHWQQWTASRGIEFVDGFPAFLDAGPAATVAADYFIPGDMHWNERGHRLIADVLLAVLRP